MNAITINLLNVALHSLLLSAFGWILVKGVLRDARHRAWAALASLLFAAAAPWFASVPAPRQVSEASPPSAPSIPSIPEWRVRVAELPPAAAAPAPLESLPASPQVESLSRWAPRLLFVWVVGAAAWLCVHLIQTIRAILWQQRLRTPAAFELALLPEEEAHHVPLRVFEGAGSPCLTGLWRPVIAVPSSAFQNLLPAQWRWVLRHEGEHRRAGDSLTAWSLGVVRALFWWNPFVHGLTGLWNQAREEICDAIAVANGGDARAYAGLLLEVAAQRRPSLTALSMSASRPARRLRARLQALICGNQVRSKVGLAFQSSAALAAALAFATLGSIGMAQPLPTPPPAATSGELVVRSFQVPPDFVRGSRTAAEALAQLGLSRPEGSSAVFIASSSLLLVKNTEENLKLLERALRRIAQEKAVGLLQVELLTKWVEITGEVPQILPPETSDYTDPQYAHIILELSQRKGIHLLSGPSVTTRLGQKATVEVLREAPALPGAPPSTPTLEERDRDFVGLRNEFVAVIAGDKLKIEAAGELRLFEGKTFLESQKLAADPENLRRLKIIRVRQKTMAALSDGHTLYIPMGETQPGRSAHLFVTARVISADGSTISFAERLKALESSPPHSGASFAEFTSDTLQSEGSPPVNLTAHVVEIRHNKGQARHDWLVQLMDLPTSAKKNDEASASAQSPPAGGTPPLIEMPLVPAGFFSLEAVYTPDQIKALLARLAQSPHAKTIPLTEFQKQTTFAGEPAIFHVGSESATFMITLAASPPVPDRTLDLEIALRLRDGRVPTKTAVSIWDGQTVVMGALVAEDGESQISRLVFITAETAN